MVPIEKMFLCFYVYIGIADKQSRSNQGYILTAYVADRIIRSSPDIICMHTYNTYILRIEEDKDLYINCSERWPILNLVTCYS